MNYSRFKVEDFLLDASFVRWVRLGENNEFWRKFLDDDPSKKEEVEQARLMIMAVKTLPEASLSQEHRDAIWERVEQKISEPAAPAFSRFPVLGRRWWLAASILIGTVWLGWQLAGKEHVKPVTYEKLLASAETQQTGLIEHINTSDKVLPIKLPDGSSVLIKANSRLSYFQDFFNVASRDVYISGEVFFEVAKDPEKPFFVYSNELVTKVLGTSFTIRAYPEDEHIDVSVKTGKVSVFTQSEAQEGQKLSSHELDGVVLTPNQRITLHRQELRLTRTLIGEPEMLAATDSGLQDFEFEDEPVSRIFEKMEKAYGVDIVYDEKLLSVCKITASLTNEPLYGKIKLICQALGASYQVVDARIVIHSDGCGRVPHE
jgi:transmembrane sensor